MQPAMIVLIIILILISVYQHLRLTRLEKKYSLLVRGQASGEDSHRENVQCCFSKYGIYRYDAFDTVQGNLSFVLVLLSDQYSGIILNSMQDRDTSHFYVKEVIKGEPVQPLSREEEAALSHAFGETEEMLEK